MTKVSALVAAAALFLSGCSANYHSIYRHQPVDSNPTITLVDAKQRAILSSGPKKAVGNPNEITKFCAEPSPDVFAVIAQALSGGATFGKSADPVAIQAALSGAFSTNEQGSTIPRTQTTNVLRELMFRTCERYLNGGINGAELSLQAARDQRLIVSILAIEGLTGAVAARPVVIGASANGAAGSSNNDVAVRVDEQNKVIQQKSEALKKKQAAFDEQNGTAKDCETIAKAVTDKKEGDLTQALKDKRAKCEATSAELVAAKKEKTDADDHYKTLVGLAGTGSVPASAGGSVMAPSTNGALDTNRPTDMATVASAVQTIVAGTFAQDEAQLMCVKALQDDSLKELRANCNEYLKSRVAVETARNLATEAEIQAAKQRIQKAVDVEFEAFWSKVGNGSTVDSSKLAALQKNVAKADWPACFDSSQSKDEFAKCFGGLRAQQQRDLTKGKSSDGKP